MATFYFCFCYSVILRTCKSFVFLNSWTPICKKSLTFHKPDLPFRRVKYLPFFQNSQYHPIFPEWCSNLLPQSQCPSVLWHLQLLSRSASTGSMTGPSAFALAVFLFSMLSFLVWSLHILCMFVLSLVFFIDAHARRLYFCLNYLTLGFAIYISQHSLISTILALNCLSSK